MSKTEGQVIVRMVNLILELVTPDGLSTSAITTSEISSLDHEVLDDTVEGGSLIAKSFLK